VVARHFDGIIGFYCAISHPFLYLFANEKIVIYLVMVLFGYILFFRCGITYVLTWWPSESHLWVRPAARIITALATIGTALVKSRPDILRILPLNNGWMKNSAQLFKGRKADRLLEDKEFESFNQHTAQLVWTNFGWYTVFWLQPKVVSVYRTELSIEDALWKQFLPAIYCKTLENLASGPCSKTWRDGILLAEPPKHDYRWYLGSIIRSKNRTLIRFVGAGYG